MIAYVSYISYYSSVSYELGLSCSPQMVNPSETSLNVQAAVKNTVTNAVFFFSIPISMEVLMVPGIVMEVQALAAAWRSIDDSQEVSQVVNGNIPFYCICS